MAKIIVAKGDTVLQEMDLSKERITIGRRSYNDIVINDLAISGEHAVIVTEKGDSFLEDLNSTNGTQINGQPVRKHFLRHRDMIEMAGYNISYFVEPYECRSFIGQEVQSEEKRQAATIRLLSGPNAGREYRVNKTLTTVGMQGRLAIVTRHMEKYYISHVEGDCGLVINGRQIANSMHTINNRDIIEIADIRMEFFCIDHSAYM